ncbi:MAG: MFS transporter [Thermoplasmata archaeon]
MAEYKWTVLSNTTLSTLMSSLDSNIVLISLPTIARELPDTTILDLLWILMGYILVTAAVVVNFGRLSDMFGRMKLYTLGFAIFTVGSGPCSLSKNGPELIGFRLVQGMGSAFLFPNSGAIITDAFPENERGRALWIKQVAIVAGSVSGLILGGVLTNRMFAAGNVAIFLNSLARGAVTFFLVFYLQGPTMGLNPFVAGLFLVPMSISLSFFGPISGFISDRHGARVVSTVGLLPSLILIGSGMGIFASPKRASIMNSCPPSKRGVASGMSSTLVNVGNIFSMGISFYVMSLTLPIASLARIFIGSSSRINNAILTESFLRLIHNLFYLSTLILLIAIIPSVLRGKKVEQYGLLENGKEA